MEHVFFSIMAIITREFSILNNFSNLYTSLIVKIFCGKAICGFYSPIFFYSVDETLVSFRLCEHILILLVLPIVLELGIKFSHSRPSNLM